MDHERQQPSKGEIGNEPEATSNLVSCCEEDLQSETIHGEPEKWSNSLDASKKPVKSTPTLPSRRSRRGRHTSQDAASNELVQFDQDKNAVEPHFPTFVVEMKRSNVIAGFWLNIPAEFSCKHLPNKDEPVLLQDAQGLKWETKFLARKNALSAGWSRFAVDHHLELGHALVFELIKPLEFLVHITRVSKSCKRGAAATVAANNAPDHSNSPHMQRSSQRKRMKIDTTQDEASVVEQRPVTTRSSQKVNVHSMFHVRTRRRGSGPF